MTDSPRLLFGRSGGIRTRDPLHPMQVRYQAALHPEQIDIVAYFTDFASLFVNFLFEFKF